MLLELDGFNVACAANGQKGIDFLSTTQILPNMILIDLMMPIKDGFEFRIEELSNSRFAAIPVVVVTPDYASRKRSFL